MAVVLSNPNILGGTPCFAGTRVPAETLFVYLARGHTVDYFLAQFPSVTREQALAALDLARQGLADEALRTAPPRKAAG